MQNSDDATRAIHELVKNYDFHHKRWQYQNEQYRAIAQEEIAKSNLEITAQKQKIKDLKLALCRYFKFTEQETELFKELIKEKKSKSLVDSNSQMNIIKCQSKDALVQCVYRMNKKIGSKIKETIIIKKVSYFKEGRKFTSYQLSDKNRE